MQRRSAHPLGAVWYMVILLALPAGCVQMGGGGMPDDVSDEDMAPPGGEQVPGADASRDGSEPPAQGREDEPWPEPEPEGVPWEDPESQPSACDGPAPFHGDRLLPGEVLRSGAMLASLNGQFQLAMQDDGNLVHYLDIHGAHRSHWASETHGQGPSCAKLDGAGRLVVMTRDGHVTWSSDGEQGRQLVVQDDGNLVLYRELGPDPWEGPASSSWAHNRPLDWIAPGQRLLAGWFMTSHNWSCKLIMQHDGNLVLYTADGGVRWASDTDDNPGSHLIFQDDGNVVIYDAGGVPRWATDTDGRASDFFRLGGDCTAFLTEGDVIPWRAPEPEPEPEPEPQPEAMCCLLEPEGGPVTSPVGPRWGAHHYGIDYGLPIGTPIVAGFSGTVEIIYRGWPNCYDNGCTEQCMNRTNLIKIRGDCDDPQRPGNQLVAWYVHIDRVADGIVEGMRVNQGDLIAFSGNSGCSTGPHLHLEVASVPRGARVSLQSAAHINPPTRYCR